MPSFLRNLAHERLALVIASGISLGLAFLDLVKAGADAVVTAVTTPAPTGEDELHFFTDFTRLTIRIGDHLLYYGGILGALGTFLIVLIVSAFVLWWRRAPLGPADAPREEHAETPG